MSYTINTTTGQVLITIPDGTADGPEVNQGSNSTNLDLFGKNYPTFGQAQNQNFIRLLQNFANTLAPDKPLEGQLWYDVGTTVIRSASAFTRLPISVSAASTVVPVPTPMTSPSFTLFAISRATISFMLGTLQLLPMG